MQCVSGGELHGWLSHEMDLLPALQGHEVGKRRGRARAAVWTCVKDRLRNKNSFLKKKKCCITSSWASGGGDFSNRQCAAAARCCSWAHKVVSVAADVHISLSTGRNAAPPFNPHPSKTCQNIIIQIVCRWLLQHYIYGWRINEACKLQLLPVNTDVHKRSKKLLLAVRATLN